MKFCLTIVFYLVLLHISKKIQICSSLWFELPPAVSLVLSLTVGGEQRLQCLSRSYFSICLFSFDCSVSSSREGGGRQCSGAVYQIAYFCTTIWWFECISTATMHNECPDVALITHFLDLMTAILATWQRLHELTNLQRRWSLPLRTQPCEILKHYWN